MFAHCDWIWLPVEYEHTDMCLNGSCCLSALLRSWAGGRMGLHWLLTRHVNYLELSTCSQKHLLVQNDLHSWQSTLFNCMRRLVWGLGMRLVVSSLGQWRQQSCETQLRSTVKSVSNGRIGPAFINRNLLYPLFKGSCIGGELAKNLSPAEKVWLAGKWYCKTCQ